MPVHWTDDARATIIPRRGHGDKPDVTPVKRADLVEGVKISATEGLVKDSGVNTMVSRWETQRKALAVAKDADFAAALEQARALWPTFAGNEIGQSSLGYAFPDEADWAAVATRAILDRIKQQKGKIAPYEVGVALLGAVAVPELQTALAKAAAAKRMALYALTDHITTMIDLTGDVAAEGLAALLATATGNSQKVDFASALALIESDEAALALAGAVSAKVVLPIAKEYFGSYPKLAKTALGKVAKSSGTSAPIASQLLKSL
jgi:hypothetical protein